MQNRNAINLFNATDLFIKEMEAAEMKLDLTLAIARLTLRIEEYYELEPA